MSLNCRAWCATGHRCQAGTSRTTFFSYWINMLFCLHDEPGRRATGPPRDGAPARRPTLRRLPAHQQRDLSLGDTRGTHAGRTRCTCALGRTPPLSSDCWKATMTVSIVATVPSDSHATPPPAPQSSNLEPAVGATVAVTSWLALGDRTAFPAGLRALIEHLAVISGLPVVVRLIGPIRTTSTIRPTPTRYGSTATRAPSTEAGRRYRCAGGSSTCCGT